MGDISATFVILKNVNLRQKSHCFSESQLNQIQTQWHDTDICRVSMTVNKCPETPLEIIQKDTPITPELVLTSMRIIWFLTSIQYQSNPVIVVCTSPGTVAQFWLRGDPQCQTLKWYIRYKSDTTNIITSFLLDYLPLYSLKGQHCQDGIGQCHCQSSPKLNSILKLHTDSSHLIENYAVSSSVLSRACKNSFPRPVKAPALITSAFHCPWFFHKSLPTARHQL